MYLAKADGKSSVTDVTFNVNGGASGTVLFTITSDTDTLYWCNTAYWYNTAALTQLNLISTSGTTISGVTSFGLVGSVQVPGVSGTTNYYSNLASGGAQNGSISYFAFFEAPEPPTTALVSLGLLRSVSAGAGKKHNSVLQKITNKRGVAATLFRRHSFLLCLVKS